MYAITGATGHVGGAAARALQAQHLPVRRVVRNPVNAGPTGAVADLTDRAALTTALRGCDGAFVLLPTLPSGSDADHRRMADTIAGAWQAAASRTSSPCRRGEPSTPRAPARSAGCTTWKAPSARPGCG
ncbi:hypothetical protein BJF85_17525 [Saccharomonospora sp. CUA-673]|uniref:SDR family oxidoreductase n=1 Tax=Saccharomonospora sp. CUA-673 TaxID=1904969 RepID=UPI0009671354|nr:NAD(P)H-binding protein [Saccharomonospora sp. CUA-673]OLT46229.1 hypothetical protein BJF85_17525 [Saccharomonospora sp. CUA-673]